MKKNVDSLIHASPHKIIDLFLQWIKETQSETAYSNIDFLHFSRHQSNLFDFVTTQQSTSWFREAKKRKLDTITQHHLEREAKIQKMDATPSMEFFSDAHLFIYVLDYLELNDLIELRKCCRYTHQILEQCGPTLIQKFHVSVLFYFCSQAQRGICTSSSFYKKKCLITGVAKEAISRCIVQKKTKPNYKKDVQFTKLLLKQCIISKMIH